MFAKDIPRSATSYTVGLDKLRQGVTYEFRVVAVNKAGFGEPSRPSTAVSGKPVRTLGGHIKWKQAPITWKPGLQLGGGAAVDRSGEHGYRPSVLCSSSLGLPSSNRTPDSEPLPRTLDRQGRISMPYQKPRHGDRHLLSQLCIGRGRIPGA